MKIGWAQFGPYGEGWWGIKLDSWNLQPGYKYGKIMRLTISLGKQKAWDGYQINNGVNRMFGWVLYYGKSIPKETNEETY